MLEPVRVTGEAVLMTKPLAVMLFPIFTALAVVLALVIVTTPRRVVVPPPPSSVTAPAVPALRERVWAPAFAALTTELEPEKEMFAPAATAPPFVLSRVTEADKREALKRVMDPPAEVMF